MLTWSTYILAKCPITGEITRFNPDIKIKAPTRKLALDWAQNNGLGYLHIEDGYANYSVEYYTGKKEHFDNYLN